MTNIDFYQEGERGTLPIIPLNNKLHDPRLYQPARELRAAVNVALALGQPLLLTGEPGTGKTELAHHLAYYFGLGDALVFNAQTTSVAKDLFYRYDALAHFQYSQTQKKELSFDDVENKFIRYQALGKSIKDNRRVVVLIDEIDKAPRDLPNDVLNALDKLCFDVPEVDKHYEASSENRPLIILTSNSEKNLPDAFLRRVVYYNILFPDETTMARIVSAKVHGYSEFDLAALISHFNDIRKQVKLRKYPATAELIQWASLLRRLDFPAAKLIDPNQLTSAERDTLLRSYSVLGKSKDDLKALYDRV